MRFTMSWHSGVRAIFCAIVVLVLTIPAFADRPTSGKGPAIKDAISGVLNKTETLVNSVSNLCDLNCQSTDAGKAFNNRMNRLKEAQTRAKNAHNRTTAAEYDKVNRKNNKSKSKDGCDPDTEVCLDGQSVAASPNDAIPEYDEEQGKDTVEDLNDLGSDVDQLSSILAGNVPPPHPTGYPTLEEAEYSFPDNMWPSPTTLWFSFIGAQAAEKANAVAEKACHQTWVALGAGGNTSLACISTVVIYEIVKGTYETMEFITREKANSEINGSYRRLKNVYDSVLKSGGDIAALKQIVDAMGEEMLILKKNQEYIIQLLQTPQGQRPGFPK